MTGASKAHRLPADVRPRRYDLHLRCDPAAPSFQGKARIAVDLARPVQALELHARGLTFKAVGADQGGARVAGSATIQPDTESATLRFERPLAAGPAVLDLAWEAPVSPSLQGLYLSRDGPEACLVTQCEATDARGIFPCFDEPAFKAILAWTITAPAGLTVLANGPSTGTVKEPDGWVTWRFAPTPPLSSYLAALAVGAFESTPEATAGRTPFRVWAMEGKARLGLEARDAAARMLPWYEDYFGVPYRFGKYDQLAVPSFAFGAMENAGLVVFRASRLLMDPRTAGWRDRRDITLVVAHEFAHQWFGNDVTMRWWDDLWLNESFAEWIAHRCVHSLWPEHEVWIDFQGRTTGAMATDALGETHAIYHPIETPAEAAESFDAITYGKGSAVLRMLEAFLGEDAFRAGLRGYMKAFTGANAAGADLWQHLGRAADKPVERIMRSWILQPGHPVLRVALQEGPGGPSLALRQERYRSRPGASPGDQQWEVPVVVRWADDAGHHSTPHLLQGREGRVGLQVQGRLRWAHANAGDVGFYRTDPDEALLQRLRAHLPDLTPAERAGLLRDQWGLARSGRRPVEGCMGLLAAALPAERHYAVGDLAVGIARDAERLLEMHGDDAALQGFRRWVGRLAEPLLEDTGPDARPGEAPSVGLLRAAAYRALAGIARDHASVAQATRLADRERADPASVDPNLAGTVVGLAAQAGDGARYDLHLATYKARRDAKASPQEADRYLGSLVAFRPAPLVQRTLGLLEDGSIPTQSVGPLLIGLLREPHAQGAAWTFLSGRWEPLRTRVGDSWMANLVEACGALPPALRGEVEPFLEAHGKGFVQSRRRALDLLGERAEVMARVAPGLAAWARSA